MFKFNFSSDDDHSERSTYFQESDTLQWAKATEIFITREQISCIDRTSPQGSFECENRVLSYILPEGAKELKDDSITLAESLHSDLIPAKYEGGLKIWECTYDLASYILGKVLHLFRPGVTVLDLGCGTGMLGIIALLQDCTVHFQDYNASVLSAMTIPNILLNVNDEETYEKLSKCRFFCGDWKFFTELTDAEDIKYDVILTSETIYNPNNYPKLHTVFQKRLKKTGIIFLAAKTHYFGVGGGLRQFESFIHENNTFSYTNCWKCKGGVRREILQLEHIQNDKE